MTWPAGVTGTITYNATSAVINIATVLPLSLIDFSGRAIDSHTLLNWETAAERNTHSFSVERSQDGKIFAALGFVTAAGSGSHSYSYTDLNPYTGDNYYRLKMTDKDGTFTYSQVITVNHASKGNLQIVPVPARNQIRITSSDKEILGKKAAIYHASGIKITDVLLQSGMTIDISDWAAGTYLLFTPKGTYRFVKL